MVEELTGMALREAVATALGYRPYGQTEPIESAALMRPDGTRGPFVLPEDVWVYAPPFESSLDACFAPGGPVERLREFEFGARWDAVFYLSADAEERHMAHHPADLRENGDWPLYLTAEAVCRAFLAAVNPASSTRHEEE